VVMDPPRHVDWRRNIAPSFTARVIAGLEPQIRDICRVLMASAAEQGDVEFVHDVTSSLPSQVVGRLMGLPEQDWAQLHEWAELSTSGQDPDINPEGYKDPSQGAMHMVMYAMEWAARRRQEPPREDLTTLILEAEVDGRTMTDVEFGSFFNQLVTAGNDTTKTMLASGLAVLLAHPEQLQALRDDPARIPDAIEEILRWANPLHYFRRTASADTELGGVRIEAGQKLAMMYTSANRDEGVFPDPHAFDISRRPNPHLSFGIGEHFCLGAHLARLEGRVFFEELLGTFPRMEQTGPAVRVRSNLNNALKRLPIRLER
jgi:cytochrome P450